MSHMYRRCSKCGATQASNPELRMHRFPALCQNNENFYQLMSWAMFCYPEKDWFDLKAVGALHKSCKVICSRHFEDLAYTSSAKIRLQKFAMPSMENQENLHAPTAGPSREYKPNVLGVHGQTMPVQPEVPPSSLETSDDKHIMQPEKPQMISEKMTSMPSGSRKKASSQTIRMQNLSTFENKIYNKCKYLLKKVAKLKTDLKQRKSIDVVQVLHNNEDVTRLLKLNISPSMALMLQGEIQNGQRKYPGRRWNENQKFLGLELYKKLPAHTNF